METPMFSDSEDSGDVISNVTTIKRITFYRYKWQVIVDKPSRDYGTKLILAPKQKLPDGFGELELILDTNNSRKDITARINLQENGKKCIIQENKKYFLHIRMYESSKRIGSHVAYMNTKVIFEDKFESRYQSPITRNPPPFNGINVLFKMVEELIETQGQILIPRSTWNNDIKQLYNNEELHDVVFIVGSATFKAHKVILMARSPVFQAMFSVDMVEKKDNKVTIRNVTPDVFTQLLKYIYTDKIDKDQASIELGYAANMYGLLRLLSICNSHLQKTIDVSNAIAIIKYSIDVVCDELKDFAIKFVKSNDDQFSNKEVMFVMDLEPRKKQRV